MMRLNRTFHVQFVLSLGLFLLLTACGGTQVVTVRVTPTPDTALVAQAETGTAAAQVGTLTQIAVLSATSSATPSRTDSPTVTSTLIPSSPEATPIPVTPLSYFGPVVGTDYVSPTAQPIPATQEFIEIPTVTPTPNAPTAIPQPSNTPGPSPTPIPMLDASRMGIQMYTNMGFDSWMQTIGLAQGTGVGWIKVQVNWAFLQPDGANDFNAQMQSFEQQMEALKRAGYRVFLSVAKAPNWARSNPSQSGPPDNPQALADFLTYILTQTKIGGVTDAIEIWNEPNLIREWTGILPFGGAGYMQLFAPAYQAIRAYSPSITIVTAGLAPAGTLEGVSLNDRDYLQQMYSAGLANYADVVIGAHPYGWGNAPDFRCCDPVAGRGWDDDPHFFFLETLEATHQIMVNNGQGDRPIWATEFGWATWEGLPTDAPQEWMTYNTAQDQANYNIRAFQLAQQNLPYVGVMFLWNLNFANAFTVENRNEIAAYSLINPVLFPSERVGYWALARATGALTP